YTPAHLAARILRERGALTGERKQVTVLFADVAGFSSLSERLDPEEVHTLINRAFELTLAEVHAYEGTVNQFLGDGLMALFGAPVAHEDHAQRAAHAALGMQRVLLRYREELQRERGIDFRVRLGLNTGLVVVGAIGDNLRMDYTAVGDTTNIAARMQQVAEPGQILVAEPTQRLIAPYFELRQLGTFPVKNRAQPVAAWELCQPRARVSRLAARAAHGLSPFVGRDEALAELERAWAAARGGRGQVALVVGDAGMGKSRLLFELQRRIGEAATWVQGDCVSYGQSIPFLPVVDMLKRNFGIEDEDGEAAVIARIGRGCAFLGADAPSVEPFLRYLLSVDPGDPAIATMDSAQRRAQVVAALHRLTAAGSRRRPIVLVVEDAHWIDGATEDYLKSLVDGIPGLGALLIVTYRPVYQQPFGDRTYFWRIALHPVEEDAALRIVRAALAVDDLPADLVAAISGKAEGNPFFLEELGRALMETGAVRSVSGRLVLAQPANTLVVPETVQDLIAARLDRLAEPQKRTVQTAAVIGREFALSLLRRVSDVQGQLEQSLDELKRIELIYERLGAHDLEYVFRHALTQDVAYGSMLQSERRRLHALIGAAIEDVHAERLEERTEELVYHFTRGEVWDKVVPYAREAAERAAALCVDDRAVEFYETALQALRHLPESPDTARAGVEVRLAMRAPLWRGGEPERLFALFKEAEPLASRYGLTEHLDTIYAFLVQYHWARGEHDRAIDYGQRCLERAAARDDLGLRVTGMYYLCHAYWAIGRFSDALREARDIMALLAGPRATDRFGLSGMPYAGACGFAAMALAELGDFTGALEMLDAGQRVADGADHLYSQMVVAATRGRVLVATGRAHDSIVLLEQTAATCRDKRFVGQLINALKYLAEAYVMTGRPADAIAPARESIALQEQAKVYVERPFKHSTLARAYLALGDLDQAEAELGQALAFAERNGERGNEGWARLVGAEIAARRGDRACAARLLDEAQDVAEELAMRPLLERCRALLRSIAAA
ncbi:MAG TPA: adenylate/guanylate cyclase domain-containing protein, partial [Methylomirabilota bacterium]|nr:adenylate/guanylate cyclase domain-containing protein [Methylomirabilota bacterium]